MDATAIEPIFDLAGLIDDVVGVVMCRIVDQRTLGAIAMASRRFFRIYSNIMRTFMAQSPTRADRITGTYSNIKYVPLITSGLYEFHENIISECHIRPYSSLIFSGGMYAIYAIYYSKCSHCRKVKNSDGTTRRNILFKIRLIDIRDNIVDHVVVETVEVCDACLSGLESTHNLYYMNYTCMLKIAPPMPDIPNYKIRKLTMRAFKPMIVINPNL